jgi:hypothetical protein
MSVGRSPHLFKLKNSGCAAVKRKLKRSGDTNFGSGGLIGVDARPDWRPHINKAVAGIAAEGRAWGLPDERSIEYEGVVDKLLSRQILCIHRYL